MNLFEIKEGMLMAWASLKSNKMRSFLTILGVLIGVTAVIGMVSIIQGLNNSMAKQIESLGSNVIYVTKFKIGIRLGNISEEERKRKEITFEDAIAVREYCPSISEVSPQNWGPGSHIAKFGKEEDTRFELIGVLPEYEVVNNNFVKEGRFFTDSDVNYRAEVVVLGPDVKERLFPYLDPIGKEILLGGATFSPKKFTVIGVMEKRPNILGGSMNNFILLPYWTFMKLYPQEKGLLLIARPKSPDVISKAIDEITELMRRRRALPPDKPNDFAVSTQDDLMNVYHQITTGVYLAMVVISSIGLLVGGVGVMNIMLVSVTERTREIGIRKAIGAKKRDIVWQFLIEAMTLSGTGGVLGIVVGVVLSQLIALTTPLPASISVPWVIIGFSVAVSVGLIFGIYPAYRAAKVDPIVSLRYE
ncbi:MAG: ABC transporter permease [candidate division Zixibacteria bacterium]|nr:ABC transporter permease [candidate division Zixibacteria bacterium]